MNAYIRQMMQGITATREASDQLLDTMAMALRTLDNVHRWLGHQQVPIDPYHPEIGFKWIDPKAPSEFSIPTREHSVDADVFPQY